MTRRIVTRTGWTHGLGVLQRTQIALSNKRMDQSFAAWRSRKRGRFIKGKNRGVKRSGRR